jgi:MFS family permease
MRRREAFDVLRIREFRLVFGAALVSLLGDGIVPVALSFAVLDLTGSATDLGIVLAAGTAALVCSLLFGGVLADRVGRRTVMIGADLIRMLGQVAIGVLLLSGHADVASLAASQAVLGAATGFFNPASSGLMPAVAGEHLQQANALRGMAMAAGSIGGPALGGLLVVAVDPGAALLIDAASYAASALLLARLRGGVPTRTMAPRPFLRDLRDGFAELRSRTWAWSIILVAAFVNTVGVAFPVLGAVVAKRELGGAAAWATILVSRAVGLFVGGTILLRARPKRPLLVALTVSATSALPLVLLALPAPLILISFASLLAGLGGVVFNTLWETTLQEQVPPHARSRVSSYDWFGSLALQPIGYVLIGPLAAGVGVSSALYICAVLETAALVPLYAVREIRMMAPGGNGVEPSPPAGSAHGDTVSTLITPSRLEPRSDAGRNRRP